MTEERRRGIEAQRRTEQSGWWAETLECGLRVRGRVVIGEIRQDTGEGVQRRGRMRDIAIVACCPPVVRMHMSLLRRKAHIVLHCTRNPEIPRACQTYMKLYRPIDMFIWKSLLLICSLIVLKPRPVCQGSRDDVTGTVLYLRPLYQYNQFPALLAHRAFIVYLSTSL